MEHARVAASRLHSAYSEDDDANTTFDSVRSRGAGPASVASIGSGLAQSARSIAGSFNCAGGNDRTNVVIEHELSDDISGEGRRSRSAPRSPRRHSSDRSASISLSSRPSSTSRSSVGRSRSNRSFREV